MAHARELPHLEAVLRLSFALKQYPSRDPVADGVPIADRRPTLCPACTNFPWYAATSPTIHVEHIPPQHTQDKAISNHALLFLSYIASSNKNQNKALQTKRKHGVSFFTYLFKPRLCRLFRRLVLQPRCADAMVSTRNTFLKALSIYKIDVSTIMSLV